MVARGLLGSGCRTIKFGGKGKDAGSCRLKMFDSPRTIKHVRFDKHWIEIKSDCEVERKASQKAQKELEADGSIERTARSFRRRMQKIIDAQGAPTEK